MAEIEEKLQIECTPLSWPIGMGKTFKGVYNIYKKTLHLFTPGQNTRDIKGILIEDLNDPKVDELLGKLGRRRSQGRSRSPGGCSQSL